MTKNPSSADKNRFSVNSGSRSRIDSQPFSRTPGCQKNRPSRIGKACRIAAANSNARNLPTSLCPSLSRIAKQSDLREAEDKHALKAIRSAIENECNRSNSLLGSRYVRGTPNCGRRSSSCMSTSTRRQRWNKHTKVCGNWCVRCQIGKPIPLSSSDTQAGHIRIVPPNDVRERSIAESTCSGQVWIIASEIRWSMKNAISVELSRKFHWCSILPLKTCASLLRCIPMSRSPLSSALAPPSSSDTYLVLIVARRIRWDTYSSSAIRGNQINFDVNFFSSVTSMFEIPKIANEIPVSNLIRQMRWRGTRNIQALGQRQFGGYRQKSLIPCSHEQMHRLTSGGSYVDFLKRFGGRPNPKQLVGSRKYKPESTWLYLLEKQNSMSYLRYCPSCAKTQFEEGGFSWWTVEHNLPGMLSCHNHQTPLHTMSWQEATQNWGLLPHECNWDFCIHEDDLVAQGLSENIVRLHLANIEFCPFVVALIALETIRCATGCDSDVLISNFMNRFAERFPAEIQMRIGLNETISPDQQVRRLIEDGILETPLATILVAMTAFVSVESFITAYIAILRGAMIRDTGSIIPGKALDRALDRHPDLAFRILFH